MLQRWKMSHNNSMVTEPDGEWVEYKDHLAAIAEKDREIERIQTNIDVMKRIAEMKIPYCDADDVAHSMRDIARDALSDKCRGES